jgi:hypothetical protein
MGRQKGTMVLLVLRQHPGRVCATTKLAGGSGSPDTLASSRARLAIHQAFDIARHQQAKSVELRTAVSLGRLWRDQGKRAEARDLLAPVYNWLIVPKFFAHVLPPGGPSYQLGCICILGWPSHWHWRTPSTTAKMAHRRRSMMWWTAPRMMRRFI